MYQWRKFEFFEDKYAGKSKIGDEIEGEITCSSSGRGKVAIGSDDGTVGILDRGFKFSYGFRAHSSSVLHLQLLKQRNYLLTIGEDEQIPGQASAMCLKIFDLDKTQTENTSTAIPDCIQILRIFTNQFPEAKITSFLVLEEAPPQLLIAIGLDTGSIYCIEGDMAREKITRFKLQVNNASYEDNSAVTGMGFRVEGQATLLFAVTPSSVSSFTFQSKPPKGQTLDQIGCHVNCVAMSDRSELIIGRPEAVYFYEADGRGPCWAFEGEKKFVGWFRGYLLTVVSDQRGNKYTFNIYDLKNRLIAHSAVVNKVACLLCEWGTVILIMADKSALCVGEKDMESKLDMLFKKNLYTVAINLVQSQQADAGATAEVLRKYGDHLYSKQDYDAAMAQYILTIGHLEPSFVIQKFLDAQRIYNLTNYLEKLHEKGVASKDHTTLLLNCYTKLKDVEKLNLFIKSEDGGGEHKFDVETVIRVCRAANYHEHAMYVAKKAGRHELFLKILLEDLHRYDEALQYICSLEPSQAGLTVKEYGKILIEHKPAETIEILMRLCTDDGKPANRGILSMLPSAVDFLNIFVHHPQSLMEFLEKYTDKVKDSPAQVEIHNTLLELYLSRDLAFPEMSHISNGDINHEEGFSNGVSNGKFSSDDEGRAQRREKGLRLLKSAWPSDEEHPLYDVDLAIILCEMNNFTDGMLFLYEKLKLYKEVISCYMQNHDHEGLIACCKRLGDSGSGGDPSLWADLLKYFGELGEDCSKEVKEVLTYIERNDILPPIIVLQTLSQNPCLTLSVIKDYIARKLEQESKRIEEDRQAIEKYQEFPMPGGAPVWHGNLEGKDLDSIFGFIEAYVVCPKTIKKPFLPYRDKNNTLIFPTGEFVGVYYSEELKYARDLGYTVIPISGYLFERMESPFRDFVRLNLEDTSAMRKEIEDLRTNARIFQLSKCTACTFTLDLPAVHFMCMHSFHQRCLGDNEKECPECAPEYRSVLEMKRSLEQNSKDQDRFFQKVRSAKDGFSVIAEYFGKGIISKTSEKMKETPESS